jgi:hypothetical protein
MATKKPTKKKGVIEKYGSILGVISIFLSIITIPATYYFAIRADYLAQITTNFDSQIIQLSSDVSFNTIAWYYPNGTFISGGHVLSGAAPGSPVPSVAQGTLNISIIVVSPHVSVLNLSDAINSDNFIVTPKQSTSQGMTESNVFGPAPFWLEPDLLNRTSVIPISFPVLGYFVTEGANKIDFSIALHADFYVNPEFILSQNGSLMGGDNLSIMSTNIPIGFKSMAYWPNFLGTINIEAKLQDLQTNSVQTKILTADVNIPVYLAQP